MPELPEVETICRGLAPLLIGQKISGVGHSEKKLRMPLPVDFQGKITGKRIINISRRAKYIQIVLEDEIVMVVHLGMSGKLIAYPAPPIRLKHDHVWMQLDNGGELVFNDPRRFGLVAITDASALPRHALFAHLGIEPLSAEYDGDFLYKQSRGKKTPLKHWLMDARVMVGVGNIYASESLFRAQLSPEKPAGSLNKPEAKRLAQAVKAILEAAIASGGSTLRDYVGAHGDAGYFQHHFVVYGKEGKPCEACGHSIKRIIQSGRSTFYCTQCQH